MDTIEINGKKVKVLAEHINKYGYEDLCEIAEYPVLTSYTNNNGFIYKTANDWVVIETKEMKLYMNNDMGYIVIIEFQKHHYEDKKGLVVDEMGHIYYTTF
jgi:hypothetical protein